MLPFAIVKDFDVFKNLRLHFRLRRIAYAMNVFVLEAVEPAFSGRVIPLRRGVSPEMDVQLIPNQDLPATAEDYVQDTLLFEITHALNHRAPGRRLMLMAAIIRDRSLIDSDTIRAIADSQVHFPKNDALGEHFIQALKGEALWNPTAVFMSQIRREKSLRDLGGEVAAKRQQIIFLNALRATASEITRQRELMTPARFPHLEAQERSRSELADVRRLLTERGEAVDRAIARLSSGALSMHELNDMKMDMKQRRKEAIVRVQELTERELLTKIWRAAGEERIGIKKELHRLGRMPLLDEYQSTHRELTHNLNVRLDHIEHLMKELSKFTQSVSPQNRRQVLNHLDTHMQEIRGLTLQIELARSTVAQAQIEYKKAIAELRAQQGLKELRPDVHVAVYSRSAQEALRVRFPDGNYMQPKDVRLNDRVGGVPFYKGNKITLFEQEGDRRTPVILAVTDEQLAGRHVVLGKHVGFNAGVAPDQSHGQSLR